MIYLSSCVCIVYVYSNGLWGWTLIGWNAQRACWSHLLSSIDDMCGVCAFEIEYRVWFLVQMVSVPTRIQVVHSGKNWVT
jgi:hypothetical protein